MAQDTNTFSKKDYDLSLLLNMEYANGNTSPNWFFLSRVKSFEITEQLQASDVLQYQWACYFSNFLSRGFYKSKRFTIGLPTMLIIKLLRCTHKAD